MGAQELEIAIQVPGAPTIEWGGPGEGKTFFITALCDGLGYDIETLVASTREPTDFSGMPMYREKDHRVDLLPVGKWVHTVQENAAAGKVTVVFMDELSCAPPAVQAATLKTVHEGIVGDVHLPRNFVRFVAAANPPEMAANGWEMAPPMANRWCHLYWRPTPQEWIQGMLSGWPRPNPRRLPQDWDSLIPSLRAMIASFIQVRPTMLQAMPKAESERGYAWPSRRTWDMASRMLAAAESVGADKDVNLKLLAGCVGEGAALEYFSWREKLDLPDPEEVLKNPDKFKLPKRGDQQFAFLSSVVAAILSTNGKVPNSVQIERYGNAWKVFKKAVEAGAPDVAATAVRALASNLPKGAPVPKEAKDFIPILQAAGLFSADPRNTSSSSS